MTSPTGRRDQWDVRFPAAQLNLVRVLLFGVLAVDAFLMLQHAPRYGAGGFNVSHLPFLDPWLPLPDRRVMVVLLLAESYLAFRIVLGIAIDVSVRILTVLWGVTYFWSQLDSYQHHYLVFLILLVAGFVPWDRARRLAAEAEDGEDPVVHSPAARLLPTQLAIVYFWAAVAKLDPRWLDGTALKALWTKDSLLPWVERVGAVTGTGDGFAALAWSALTAEIVLVFALLLRRFWPLALAVGVPLHASIEIADLEIGRFSYLLLALYALVVPESWWIGLQCRRRPVPRRLAPGRALERLRHALRAPAARFGALVGGAVAVLLLPWEASPAIAVVVLGLGFMPSLRTGRSRSEIRLRLPGAHLIACLALVGLHLVTEQAYHYYRYLGGSSRRLGDPAATELAYTRLTELAPDFGPGWTHLGNLARSEGDVDRALELYERAREGSLPDPRPYRAATSLLVQRGEHEAATEWVRNCRVEIPDATECPEPSVISTE